MCAVRRPELILPRYIQQDQSFPPCHTLSIFADRSRRRGAISQSGNFKQVVDRYGHLVGSQTIGYIGRMIGKLIRPGDFAARFGGDEFVVILPDTPVVPAVEFAEKLRAEIAACTRLDGREIDLSEVTASIGVAVFPDHAADADGLLHAADAAMYVVKGRGKNGVAVAMKGA